MKRTPRAPLSALLAVAGLLIVAACASESTTTAEIPATARPETVIAERYGEAEGRIEAVDPSNRTVTLRMANGGAQVLSAPPEADLKLLKIGQPIFLGVTLRMAVKALPPGSAPLGIVRETATAKAPPGEAPGRAAVEVTRVVSEVAAVDEVNNTLTLRGAEGGLTTLEVKNPDNQRKLKTLKVGDLVQIELIEAVGVQLRART